MHENSIATLILDACFKIQNRLGPGLFESVYENILDFELLKKGVETKKQHPIPVIWCGVKMENGFRADIIVENKVIIEIKSIERVAPVHQKQLLTYLKLTGLKLGLLINSNEALLKDGIQRIVNKL